VELTKISKQKQKDPTQTSSSNNFVCFVLLLDFLFTAHFLIIISSQIHFMNHMKQQQRPVVLPFLFFQFSFCFFMFLL
jgi:hypothetical protein